MKIIKRIIVLFIALFLMMATPAAGTRVFAANETTTIERIGSYFRTVAIDQTLQLEVKIRNGSPDEHVSWSTDSFNQCFSVSENGLITPIQDMGAGYYSVYARLDNGDCAEFAVGVYGYPEKMSFTNDQYTVIKGSTDKPYFTPGGVSETCPLTYTFSNPGIAEVDHGYLVGIQAGESKVTAEAPNGVKAETLVRVLDGDYADYIKLKGNDNCICLEVGETKDIEYVLSFNLR